MIPRLMIVLDPAAARLPLAALAGAAARGGADAVQVRGLASDREAVTLASRLRADLPPGVRVIVNERFDVAIASGADGVHLKDRGLSPAEVRAAARARGAREAFTVSVATHDVAGMDRAAAEGCDWCTVSPLREAHGRRGLGEEGLAALLSDRGARRCPVLLLGGVLPGDERLAARLLPGEVFGLAATRPFHDLADEADVEALARRWRAGLDAAAVK